MKSVMMRAALAAVAVLSAVSAAFAVDAVATTTVNVRTGPGTDFSIVGQLAAGERVDIRECTSANWCFVNRAGPSGWVSAAFLTAPPSVPVPPPAPAPAPSTPGENCSFGFTIGPGGPTLAINCGDAPPPPAPPAPPAPPPPSPSPGGDQACVYSGNNYSGIQRCYPEGTYNNLPGLNDRISSVRLFGDARIELCVDGNLGAPCFTVDVDTPFLPGVINDRASSARVFVPPPPVVSEACFYTDTNYNGFERCFGVGVRNVLPGTLNDRISSVRVTGGVSARLCADQNLGGTCRIYASDTPSLPAVINDRASSLEVFFGGAPVPPVFPLPLPPIFPLPLPPAPPPAPVTLSTGPIDLQQTFMADLDNGAVTTTGADIWYQAVTAAEKYVTPRNGAQLALGDRSNRGLDGCRVAAFSSNSIPLWDMPVGSYVCVKTNQGRISQFRLNGYTGTTMNLGYTTWAN